MSAVSAVQSGERRCISCPERGVLRQSPPNLLFEHFFNLPDLFFNFAGDVFGFAFSL
jgi:hypothetical protein